MKKFIAVAFALLVATPVFAQVSVQGVGTVFAKPDCAHLSFSIVTEHAQASKAHATNRTHSGAFFALLKKNSVEDKDVTTTHFDISPKYTYPEKADPKLVGYVVTHSLDVKVRDLKNVGTLLDGAVSDAVRLHGIRFEISDRTALQAKARDLALADAKKKATQMVTGLGEKLGKLKSVSESVSYPRPQPHMRALAAAPRAEGAATQVSSGEQAVTVNVSAVWDLACDKSSCSKGHRGKWRERLKERLQNKKQDLNKEDDDE